MSKVEQDDELLFSDSEPEIVEVGEHKDPWKLLIVDDDEEVHAVTRLVLNGFTFDGRRLECISAHSGKEAKEILAQNPDVAVMLVDVVMEHDHAGLDFVKYVREEAKNETTRIVLRTGQPGQAPERSVVRDYDINDYKEKTELTAQKLNTLIYACLRSYRDIVTLESNRHGLQQIIEASVSIFELQSMEKFAQGVLEQLVSLLHIKGDVVMCRASAFTAQKIGGEIKIIGGSGEFENRLGDDARQVLDLESRYDLEAAIINQRTILNNNRYTGYFCGHSGNQNLIQLEGGRDLSDIDRHLIEIFNHNVGVAFENMHLKQEIEDTQKEVVYRLGEAVETRSRETGNHVKRVAEFSKLLAVGYGLSDEETEIIKLASPLHDVGKIGIPDAILNKPGKLTEDEWEIMKTHAELGHEMLKDSKRPILKAGAVIALEHHEKWDGGGYPHGKADEEIHIYGRISALADVFDALASDRCYKKAWEMERVLDYIKNARETQFDPRLVDIFFAELDSFLKVKDTYPDKHGD